MKHRYKNDHCLNCGLRYERHYHYCPQCGQENTTSRISFTGLMSDLFSNYLTLDSRMGRTVLPFLFKPGAITVAFNQGRRLRYLHPVRLYILMNLLYFFAFSLVVHVDRVTLAQLAKTEEPARNQSPQPDTAAMAQAKVGPLRVQARKVEPKAKEPKAETPPSDRQGNNLATFVGWIQNKRMTDTLLIDSLRKVGFYMTLGGKPNRTDTYSESELKISNQLLKIGQQDLPLFLLKVINDIPLMMVLMLPFLALFLKLLYVRRPFLYIDHFVFVLHLQAFVYLIFGLSLLGFYFIEGQSLLEVEVSLALLPNLFILVYNYFMFKRVYQQGWLRTSVKLFLFSNFYFSILSLFMVIGFLYSFWTF
ncbi:MAG: DUF3667 domain-containing protein [Bernardetiaceae bacterium]|jgi:hypothetical protein|nr:DUF3667 domain-containing protein [Bernardetiaceae bacterium]